MNKETLVEDLNSYMSAIVELKHRIDALDLDGDNAEEAEGYMEDIGELCTRLSDNLYDIQDILDEIEDILEEGTAE